MTIEETVDEILAAPSWDERVALIRLVPSRHGTNDHQKIFAKIAGEAYVPHLAPDFAYIGEVDFYELPAMEVAYAAASQGTSGFTATSVSTIAAVLEQKPRSLLAFRTILGLTKQEFAAATDLVAPGLARAKITASKVDGAEKSGTAVTEAQALVMATTIDRCMDGTLFGDPPGELRTKQEAKPDTAASWDSVANFARDGVPYPVLLHQRHYGGAFRQLLDATSTARGNLIEDAVEALFVGAEIPYIRTGAQNQAEIAERFEVHVIPAPDFVCFDDAGSLRALLECKGANDGGTARDKALRFERLRTESVRLGGVPLLGVLGGLGWRRTNDTLGPVVRDCDGRVFSVGNLAEMLTVSPFPTLRGMASAD